MQPSHRLRRYVAAATFLASAVLSYSQSAPTLSVDASQGRHSISPYIYGMANGLDATLATELSLPLVRWGGDATTRYNWQVDASNAGFDWYFMGGNGESNPTPSGSADAMIRNYAPAAALMTIPIIPYVNSMSAWNCSFPVSVYGAQQSTNPYVHPNGDNCGNSIATNGTQLLDTNIYANHIDNSTALQQAWVAHLVSTFGSAAGGGVPFYQLDNEPLGWGNTHRDVMPNGTDYPTIAARGSAYAAAVKAADPAAMVLGPSDFTLGGWVGTPSQQNNEFAGIYYLQQMAAAGQQAGVRLLDYFDEHYYFQFSSPTTQLASTRTLWDPTYNGGTWVEQWDFDGPMQLIPRFQGWIAQNYPGTKLALSEYSIDSGNKLITDALAEMDVLAIFGRQSLDLASMWSPPATGDPIAYSFRMFRNYDGNGSKYGDTWVSSTSTDETQLAVYGAQRSSDSALTVLVINKTTGATPTTLQLAGVPLPSTAAVFQYSGANLNAIVALPPAAISSGTITASFPAYSATLFVVQPGKWQTSLALSAPVSVVQGQFGTLTATATRNGDNGAPGGTVVFRAGNVLLGSAALTNGVATLSASTAGVPTGTYPVSASYAGDSADAAAVSSTTNVTVKSRANAVLTLSATAASVTEGQPDSFQASVAGSGSVAPTGTVTFEADGVVLGKAAISAGVASFSAGSQGVPPGVYTVTAHYSGDSNDAAATSAPLAITVTAP